MRSACAVRHSTYRVAETVEQSSCFPYVNRRTLPTVKIQPSDLFDTNSQIRHSRAGRALLHSRKECRRLWVLLGSAAQAGPYTQSGMCIDSYQFLPEISSFVITCTYLFTADDNHLQKSTILSSVTCRYTGHQHWAVITSTQVGSFFFWKFNREIIWKLCVTRLL